MQEKSKNIVLQATSSYSTTLELEHHYMDEDDEKESSLFCVLCHQNLPQEKQSACILDFLPEGAGFYASHHQHHHKPPSCITGKLSCGHRFCVLGILFHMFALGMQCPICRCVS